MVASLLSTFIGPARLVDKAFGLLSSAAPVESQYQEAVASALTGLGHLQRTLEDAVSKLRTGAANYEAADRPIGRTG